MRAAPWQVQGIDPDARETARVAARRSGVSVGQWLNSVIRDQAADQGVTASTVATSPLAGSLEDDESDRGEAPRSEPAAITARPDDVGGQAGDQIDRQIEPQADDPAADRAAERPADSRSTENPNASRRIAEAILQLNGRLDQLIADGRTASMAMEQRVNSVDRALAKLTQERLRAACGSAEPIALPAAPAASRTEPVDEVDRAVAEIARRRQRALDGDVVPPPASDVPRPVFTGPHCRANEAAESLRKDLAEIGHALSEAMPRGAVEALEGVVHTLVSRLEADRQSGVEPSALAGLEQGLREVRDTLRGLAPAESLVGFDQAVKTLAGKIDPISAGRQDPAVLEQLEAAIASLRSVVGQVASGDALLALAAEVRGLADRIDRVPAVDSSAILATLERRIETIADAIETVRVQGARGVSPEFDQLVKSLNDKLERIQSTATPGEPGSPGEVLREAMSAAAAMPRSDQLAIGGLEDRIATLVEKLDASEGRLGHLEAIERGMAELLVQLENLRANPPAASARLDHAAASLPAEPEVPAVPAVPVAALSQDVAALKQAHSVGEWRTQETLEAVHDTIETVVDRIAAIETNIRREQRTGAQGPSASAASPPAPSEPAPPLAPEMPTGADTATAPTPEPSAPSAPMPERVEAADPAPVPAATIAQPRPAAPARSAAGPRPALGPGLPDDHPLEPGSGPPLRTRQAAGGAATPAMSAADRIAASEGPLRAAPGGAASEPESKTGYLQAARRAAQYAAQNTQRGEVAAATAADPDALGGKLSQRLKALFVGISVVVLIAVALRFAASYYFESVELTLPDPPALAERDDPAPVMVAEPAPRRQDAASLTFVAPTGPSFSTTSPNMTTASNRGSGPTSNLSPGLPLLAPANPFLSAAPVRSPLLPSPPVAMAAPAPSAATEAGNDVTGSVRPATRLPAAAPPTTPSAVAGGDQLPPAIGGKTLIAAATAGEPAAAYEVATRFAEGRGVPQNFKEAAVWYERAAKSGLAPALFRLGALYEKGNGVTKDLGEARRLYLAAAEKGNANAMHNIGVLYAEGIDGKPDFKTAAQWFLKSASFGIADSQYNLAVLYARGIGIDRDMSEAYRWFALAAKGGDPEAAKKRDDIATRLEPNTLAAMRTATETWVAAQPPEEAASVKPPAGGWDQAEPAKRKAIKVRRRPVRADAACKI